MSITHYNSVIPISNEVIRLFCPTCQRNNPQGQPYCTYCGTRLTVSVEPQIRTQPNAVLNSTDRSSTNKPHRMHPAVVALLIVLSVSLPAVTGAVVFRLLSPPGKSTDPVALVLTEAVDAPTRVPIAAPTDAPTAIPTAAPTKVPQLPTPQPQHENAAEIRATYYARADAIERYAEDYLDTAMAQQDINRESAIVYQKWDALLNEVYQYLKNTMAPGAFDNLKAEETDWYQRKDRAIDDEGALWEGGSGEPMARNMVGIDWTRERCYYLISLIQ